MRLLGSKSRKIENFEDWFLEVRRGRNEEGKLRRFR